MAVATEKRMQNVQDGIVELKSWMDDLYRTGIGNIPSQGAIFFSDIIAKMIDAQAPGLAAILRKMAANDYQDNNSLEKLLRSLTQLKLLLACFDQREEISENLLMDVRHSIGWYSNKQDVLKSDGTRDNWLCIWRTLERTDDNIVTEKLWFYGLNTKQFGVLFNFFIGFQKPIITIKEGMLIDASVCYYASALPLRFLIKEEYSRKSCYQEVESTVKDLNSYSAYVIDRLQQIPFVEHHPVVFNNVKLVYAKHNKSYFLCDTKNNLLPILNKKEDLLPLIFNTCGDEVSIFGLGQKGAIDIKSYWDGAKIQIINDKE